MVSPEGSKVTYVCPTCRGDCQVADGAYLDLWADAWCPSCQKSVTAIAQGPPDDSGLRAEEERRRASWPRSVEEAVDRLLGDLDPEALAAIRAMQREDLVRFHFSLGLSIRNAFGVWKGNRALLDSCGQYAASHELRSMWTGHPDDASAIIIEALWLRLIGEARASRPAAGERDD